MTVEIRLLKPDDADRLVRAGETLFDGPVDRRSLQRFLDDPRHEMMLAIEADEVLGMASAVEYFHPDKPPQLWINEVGVVERRQGQGIGRRLVGALLEMARERGCAYVWVGTETDNHAARACYSAAPGGEPPQEFMFFEWELDDVQDAVEP